MKFEIANSRLVQLAKKSSAASPAKKAGFQMSRGVINHTSLCFRITRKFDIEKISVGNQPTSFAEKVDFLNLQNDVWQKPTDRIDLKLEWDRSLFLHFLHAVSTINRSSIDFVLFLLVLVRVATWLATFALSVWCRDFLTYFPYKSRNKSIIIEISR